MLFIFVSLNMRQVIQNTKNIIFVLIMLLSAGYVNGQEELPEKPLINYVTILDSIGTVKIDWNASHSPNIQSYKIYTLDIATFPVTGFHLATVTADSLHYEYNPISMEPEVYTVVAVDNLGNESLLSGDFHKPMKMDISYDSCSSSITIKWDKYYGWKSNLTGYRIYGRENFGVYHLISDQIDTISLTYTQNDINENREYDYFVQSYDNKGNISNSNFRYKFTYMPAAPKFVNLDYVSVVDNRTVEIAFSADVSGAINDFLVSRGKSLEANFTPVATLDDVSESTVTLTDNFSTQGEQYYYRVDALNSCFDAVLSSNTGNNVLLSGHADGRNISLTWSPYVKYSSGEAEYRIFRKNENKEYALISTLSSGDDTYQEDISFEGKNKIKGEVEYFVEVLELGSNPLGFSGVSKSNEIKVNVETKLYMPNAFTPNNDTYNDYFSPIFDFIPKDFKMFIYDRSGKVLFSTTDVSIGWDGSLNGSGNAPEGVYIYHVEFVSYNGIRQVKTGNVTLLYP